VQCIRSENIVQKSYDSIAIRDVVDSTVHGQSFPTPEKARRERRLDSPISLIVRGWVDAHIRRSRAISALGIPRPTSRSQRAARAAKAATMQVA